MHKLSIPRRLRGKAAVTDVSMVAAVVVVVLNNNTGASFEPPSTVVSPN